MGIVYKTDALISSKIEISQMIPIEAQPDIRYAIARTKSSAHTQSLAFFEYLQSQRAGDIFEKHGFVFQMQ